jgi:hypothetical protein
MPTMTEGEPENITLDRTEGGEIILKAISEGGSLTLAGINAANGWRFCVVRDESTMFDLLNEADREGLEFRHVSGWMDSLDSALGRLDKYCWHMMYALQVHPHFRRQIWAAVERKAREDYTERSRRPLKRWQSLCV